MTRNGELIPLSDKATPVLPPTVQDVAQRLGALASAWEDRSLEAKSKAELWEDEHPCHSDDHHRAQHSTFADCARELRHLLSALAPVMGGKGEAAGKTTSTGEK